MSQREHPNISAKVVDNLLATPLLGSNEPEAHLRKAIEAFLLSRRVSNCTERTLRFYRDGLHRFARFGGVTLSCDAFNGLSSEEISPMGGVRNPKWKFQ